MTIELAISNSQDWIQKKLESKSVDRSGVAAGVQSLGMAIHSHGVVHGMQKDCQLDWELVYGNTHI